MIALFAVGGCDFTAPLDIETPDFEPSVSIRAVLSAGGRPAVRVSLSRDPFGPARANAERSNTPTTLDAEVSILRDGRVLEVLNASSQTCYGQQQTTCDLTTGRNVSERSAPFECGAFRGETAFEAGATYTVRVAAPGLPVAEAEVTVPLAPEVSVVEEAGPDAETRRLRVTLRDLPGAGHTYGLALQREYDAYDTSVCAIGARRDTTIELGAPGRYLTNYTTREPVLRANTQEAIDLFQFVTFDDETFDGRDASFVIETPIQGRSAVRPTGRLTIQLSGLTADLAETYRIATSAVEEGALFVEPITLPTNVEGGFGRVGAVALSEASVE